MSDNAYKRKVEINGLLDTGQLITPYALKKHKEQMELARTLRVEPDSNPDEYKFLVRKSANSAPFEVTIDELYSYYCSCKHGEEFMRPYSHVLSALLFVNNTTPRRSGPWDLRWFGSFWHLQTWRSQYLNKIHRAGVSGTDLYQAGLIPGELSRKPGRKRVRQYKPSTSNSRRCGSCGLFGHYSKSCSSPNIVKIVESKEKRTKKSAENVIIDLTQDEKNRLNTKQI